MVFKFLRSIFGMSVQEQGDFIVVKGLPADFLSSDIQKIWQTAKIGQFMFNKLSGSQMVFHKFFAPDVAFALEQVLERKRTRTNKRAVEKVLEGLKEHTWIKRIQEKHEPILNFDNLSRLKVSPLGHQKEFLQMYNDRVPRYNLKGYMLGAAPGSGKTIANLMLAECLDADQIFICSPKNAVIDVWEDTVKKIYKEPQKYWHSLQGGNPPDGTRIFIFHYEALGAMLSYAQSRGFGKVFVALDESHNFNDVNSQRTQAFVKLCEVTKTQNVVWASGTPIKAMGKEASPFLMTVDPYFKGPVVDRFEKIFGKTASRALDILAARLGYMTFTIDKKQIVNNKVETIHAKVRLKNGEEFTLPVIREKMTKFIAERMKFYKQNMGDYIKKYQAGLAHFERTNKNGKIAADFKTYKKYADTIRKQYDPTTMKDMVIFCNQFENKFIIPSLPPELKASFKDARSVYKYYDLKVQGEALGGVLGKERARCNVEIALASDQMFLEKEWDGSNEIGLPNIIDFAEKKTVVFTSYVEVVSQLSKHLQGLGFSPIEVYAETNKNLPAMVKNFADNPDANPMVATYQSLSTAVPLTMANTIVTMNYPFRAHELEQAISRADRIGQDETVRVWHIVLDTGGVDNISTRSADIMEWSREQIAAIMGRKAENGPAVAMEHWQERNPYREILSEICTEEMYVEMTGDPHPDSESEYQKGINIQDSDSDKIGRSPTNAVHNDGPSSVKSPRVSVLTDWK